LNSAYHPRRQGQPLCRGRRARERSPARRPDSL